MAGREGGGGEGGGREGGGERGHGVKLKRNRTGWEFVPATGCPGIRVPDVQKF